MINSSLKLWREAKDYIIITFGLMAYAMGWCFFLLPYQITTGGVTGISAIIYYATGIEMQFSYFLINAAFLAVARSFFDTEGLFFLFAIRASFDKILYKEN